MIETRYLTPEEAEACYHIGVRTLERMRREGRGPLFVKAGRRILYRIDDVENWLAGRSFTTTSEARRAGIR